LPEEEAVKIMTGLTLKAKTLQPSLFYKKTDSVLRGHVLAEMRAQMKSLGVAKGLLVPVNPVLGRVIKNGHYYVNGEPVHKAGFANDPEFPVKDSRIKAMLGAAEGEVFLKANATVLSSEGITVGEAQSAEDIEAWAAVENSDVLFAGGASFFNALLQEKLKYRETKQSSPQLSFPLLFVSGTTYQKNMQRIHKLAAMTCFMHDAVFATNSDPVAIKKWSNEASAILQEKSVVVMAIGERKEKGEAQELRKKISEAVQQVVKKATVKELIIEGGSTAFAIIEKIGWHSFVPTEEWAQGVVRMQVGEAAGVHLTIKPGSYEWPAAWSFERGTKN